MQKHAGLDLAIYFTASFLFFFFFCRCCVDYVFTELSVNDSISFNVPVRPVRRAKPGLCKSNDDGGRAVCLQ